MVASISAQQAIGAVRAVVDGMPAFIAGSAAAAAQPHAPSDRAFNDVDVFFASESAVVAGVQRLVDQGWAIDQRHERVWARWLKMGLGKWHTHSLKLHHKTEPIEVNCIFKLVDGHPTTSASQVIESFDFGLLAHAYDCELGIWRDLTSYLFPGMDPTGPLPLLPLRRQTWENGFISQYQGLREVGRYVRYVDYGWDLSLVQQSLATGYWSIANYMLDRGDKDKVQLGKIYEQIALLIEANDLDKLREAAAEILFMDDLDRILESLE